MWCRRGWQPRLPGTFQTHSSQSQSVQSRQGENYYYSLLLLFVPFRDEADLIEEGETAESAFERHFEENVALNTLSEKLEG